MNRSNVGEKTQSLVSSVSMTASIVANRVGAKHDAIKAREQAANLEKYRFDKDVSKFSRDAGVAKDVVKAYAEGVESVGPFTEKALKEAIDKFGVEGAREVYQDFRQERGEGMMDEAVKARADIKKTVKDVNLDSEKFMKDADRFARDKGNPMTGDQAIQEAFKISQPMGFGEQLTKAYMYERAPEMQMKPTGNKRGLGRSYFSDVEPPFDTTGIDDEEGGLL